MDRLTKFVKMLAKVLEIVAWVGSAAFAVSLMVLAFGQTEMLEFLAGIQSETDFSIAGLSVDLSLLNSSQVVGTLVVLLFTSLFSCLLGAMIFRNTYLIFKTAEGRTQFSRGATPFQSDIVCMVREIGIFALSIPVLEIIASIVARLVIGYEGAELAANINITGLFFGLVALCLSQFFAYGAQLQEDTEGLV